MHKIGRNGVRKSAEATPDERRQKKKECTTLIICNIGLLGLYHDRYYIGLNNESKLSTIFAFRLIRGDKTISIRTFIGPHPDVFNPRIRFFLY